MFFALDKSQEEEEEAEEEEEETRGIEFVKNKLKVFGCGAC